MKSRVFCRIVLFLVISMGYSTVVADDMAEDVQRNIAKGQYIPAVDVTIKDMRNMPIPSSNENYAFIQSLDAVTNIVIGNFASGEREIILIKDKNSDGEVDLVAHWFVDRETFKFDASPTTTYNSVQFRKMKEDIINGVRGEVFPNQEGLEYIRVLYQNSDNIKKWRNGFLVTKYDPDNVVREMNRYSYSLSADGADMVFEIIYTYKGANRVSPIINQCVYCKNSKDKVVIEIINKLLDETKKFSPY